MSFGVFVGAGSEGGTLTTTHINPSPSHAYCTHAVLAPRGGARPWRCSLAWGLPRRAGRLFVRRRLPTVAALVSRATGRLFAATTTTPTTWWHPLHSRQRAGMLCRDRVFGPVDVQLDTSAWRVFSLWWQRQRLGQRGYMCWNLFGATTVCVCPDLERHDTHTDRDAFRSELHLDWKSYQRYHTNGARKP